MCLHGERKKKRQIKILREEDEEKNQSKAITGYMLCETEIGIQMGICPVPNIE